MYTILHTYTKYKTTSRGVSAEAVIAYNGAPVGKLFDEPERIVATVGLVPGHDMQNFITAAKAGLREPAKWIDSDQAWASEYARQLLSDAEEAEQSAKEAERTKGLDSYVPQPGILTDNKDKSTNAAAFYEYAAGLLQTLYGRWQDERGYEAIGDYAAPLRPIAEKCGCVIVRMNSRPFGCDFTTNGRTYKLTINNSQMGYKRIK